MNIDTLVQSIWSIREDLRGLAAQEKELKEKYTVLKNELLVQLDEQGVSGIKTTVARVHITESQVPKLIDWEAFCSYIADNDAFHLIQKRPAATAIKELANIQGYMPPGVDLITLRDISITTAR
jgi:hypothetical protein